MRYRSVRQYNLPAASDPIEEHLAAGDPIGKHRATGAERLV